ncbi:MAG: hypothetical protein QGH46_01600 [Gammaproteobacteria bacterium]|jgi:hypothetical protein|nr:hypothetical protein [Gammaproteobacteria bacterium]MDP7269789.1 hypothetical protein [Gammaproteobacteria bacterium]HJP04662.1 hypothetical protein [Gammaproteobacteria bacterium]
MSYTIAIQMTADRAPGVGRILVLLLLLESREKRWCGHQTG